MNEQDATQDRAALPDWPTTQAVTDVLHAYAFHVDRFEPEKVAALFTVDCAVDYGPGLGPMTHGRDALQERLTNGLLARLSATAHHVSNIRLRQASTDEVMSIAYVHAWHRFPAWDARPDATIWGQYHDRLVRSSQGWLIAERTLLVSGHDGLAATWYGIGRRSDATAAPTDTSPPGLVF